MNINLDVKWYQWLFGIISIALAVLLVHDLFGTVAENQSQAMGIIALLFGGALLISLYLTFGLRWSINKTRKTQTT